MNNPKYCVSQKSRLDVADAKGIFVYFLCSGLMFGGLYVALFDLLYASVVFTRLFFGAICMAGAGGYLICTDFIAPSLGIKTWED